MKNKTKTMNQFYANNIDENEHGNNPFLEITESVAGRLPNPIPPEWPRFWCLFREILKIQNPEERLSRTPRWRIRQYTQPANQKLTKSEIAAGLLTKMEALLTLLQRKQDVAAFDSTFYTIAREAIHKLAEETFSEKEMRDFVLAERCTVAEPAEPKPQATF